MRPVISEKSYSLLAANKYTFRIHERANKTQVRQAVEDVFGGRVTGVRTAWVKPKPKRRGYTSGKTRQWKKAIVQIAPGQSIPIFQGLEGIE
jgi:large subunit ribosomal protein L23